MTRVHSVKKARKDQGLCQICSSALVIGKSYKWIQHQFGLKQNFCTTCKIPTSQIVFDTPQIALLWPLHNATSAGDEVYQYDALDEEQSLDNIDPFQYVELYKILLALPRKDRQVMCLLYGFVNGERLSYRKIARLMGVSLERIRQRHYKAMRRFWKHLDILRDAYER